MLVVENNEVSVNWHIGSKLNPLMYKGDLVITFDPSKSNMAMVVGTPDGDILTVLEFSGNNRKRGPVMDTTVYCNEVRQFLREYLQYCNFYIVAVEQAITKHGTSYHHSNMVLTEIRSNILNFFLEEFGIRVLEINNWTWKSHVHPKGYRSQSEKGSKRYFRDMFPDSPYCNYFEADVTDCICIFTYVIESMCKGYNLYCTQVESCLREYSFGFVPISVTNFDDLRKVVYNPLFSLKDNLNFYVNRISTTFLMEVPMDVIEISDCYGHSNLFDFSNLNDEKAKVVVKPCV